MKDLETIYKQKCESDSDINELLPILKKYAEKSEHITEMGVRTVVSTYALMMGKPKRLISYDIVSPAIFGVDINNVYQIAIDNNIEFEFRMESTLECDIEETDFLFIDTLHTYEQMRDELERHGYKVKKWIGFHDTSTFAENGEIHGTIGIWPAITEFLDKNPNWEICERVHYNNGLTIIENKVSK
jgi:hypothetical protein